MRCPKINYQSDRLRRGHRSDWTANTVDFGAVRRAPLADSDIAAAAKNGAPVEIPVTFGAVVVAYNLKGLSAPLKLNADASLASSMARSLAGTTRPSRP